MAILSINPVKKEIIFPLLTILFMVINTIQRNKLTDSLILTNNEDYLLANSYIIVLLMFIGESLVLIFFFIQRKNTIQFDKKELEMIPGSKIKNLKIIAIIFILAFIDFLSSIGCLYFTSSPIDQLLNIMKRSVTLIFATIFSIFILHYEYYRHHWLGLFLIIVGLLFFGFEEISDTFMSISNKNIQIFFIAYKIIVEYILESFLIVLEKYCMDIKYISSFTLVGLEGISGLFMFFCLSMTIIIFPNTFNLTISYFFDFLSLIWIKDKSIFIQYGLFIFLLGLQFIPSFYHSTLLSYLSWLFGDIS